MTDLFLHNQKINTVFDLLGKKENDITYSLGWVLTHNDTFLRCLLDDMPPECPWTVLDRVCLQEFSSYGGYTDVEIISDNLHIIIKAKRGWSLPSLDQLQKYTDRICKSKEKASAIVVMSECSPQYADNQLPDSIDGIPIKHRSWEQISKLAERCANKGSHADKRLLREFHKYLGGLISMQNQTSNLVYVVSVGRDVNNWSMIPPVDYILKKQCYFHPYCKGGWPKIAPNYLGFRYDGKLQSIHHVESYEIIPDLCKQFSEIQDEHEPHILYHLGPAIPLSKEVRTGNIYRNGRVWIALDLLLTCETISEARDETKKRLESQNLNLDDME